MLFKEITTGKEREEPQQTHVDQEKQILRNRKNKKTTTTLNDENEQAKTQQERFAGTLPDARGAGGRRTRSPAPTGPPPPPPPGASTGRKERGAGERKRRKATRLSPYRPHHILPGSQTPPRKLAQARHPAKGSGNAKGSFRKKAGRAVRISAALTPTGSRPPSSLV